MESANTAALVAAAENPFINIMGHPDDPTFPINAETLTDAAKATGTIVEFNAVGVSPDGYREKDIDFPGELILNDKPELFSHIVAAKRKLAGNGK